MENLNAAARCDIKKKINTPEPQIGVSHRVINIKKFKSPFGES